MWNRIRTFADLYPLRTILFVAIALRIIAAVYAKGYLMHDDHFLTVEPAASWAVGHNFNDWLPGIGNDRTSPEPISFFYLGFLSGCFKLMHLAGIHAPDAQMLLIRLLHGALSLVTIVYAYKLTCVISTRKNAWLVGILLATIGVLPNFSVRNLVEMVCQPFLMVGFYTLIKGLRPATERDKGEFAISRPVAFPGLSFRPTEYRWKYLVTAAIVLGLSVGVRYQLGLFVALIGAMILVQRQWWKAIVFGAISFTAFFVTQIDDVLLWGGRPFQHLQGYFAYNAEHAGAYPGSPFAYLSFIGYFILPPVSLFLLFGFIRNWKEYLLIWIPVTGFLLFHILYPNRQERFILPILPFFVLLGVIGWNAFAERSRWWGQRQGLLRGAWAFFWVANLLVLAVFSTTYSKRSRVESMLFLYRQGDCRNFIQDFSYGEHGALVPQFYRGDWTSYYTFRKTTNIERVVGVMAFNEGKFADAIQPQPVPNYVLFYNDTDLDARVERLRSLFPEMTYLQTIEPGWFDEVLHAVNPINSLERVHIYRLTP